MEAAICTFDGGCPRGWHRPHTPMRGNCDRRRNSKTNEQRLGIVCSLVYMHFFNMYRPSPIIKGTPFMTVYSPHIRRANCMP
jgi:hypothetical protein